MLHTEHARSNARVLILCGGETERWGDHLGVPKHMVPVDGMPIVERTVSQLRQRGFSKIWLIVRDNTISSPGADNLVINSDKTSGGADKFLSSRDIWNEQGPTLFLMGDVWYSDAAIDELCAPSSDSIKFLGRLTPSSFTGCTYSEIFSVCVPHHKIKWIEDALVMVKQADDPSIPTEWQLFENITELSFRSDDVSSVFIHIDDFTEDFDFIADYEEWVARRADKSKWDGTGQHRQRAGARAGRRKERKRRLQALVAGVVVGAAATGFILTRLSI